MKRGTAFAVLVIVVLGAAAVRAAEDSIAQARDLYASADYEDALAVLDRLRAANRAGPDARAVEQYRALCLLALGRNDEAQNAIADVVVADPSYRPSQDVSPRVRTAFSDVRRRMLPDIVQKRYADAKRAFDNKNFAAAADGFALVLATIADPDLAPAAGSPPLSDLRELAKGFHDLSVAAVPPPPPPAPVKAPPPAAPAPAPPPHIFSTEPNVVPPEIIRQSLPGYPGRILRPMQGALEIVIDERGAVELARMLDPVDRSYDSIALDATRAWKYRPATVDGVPVKFRKVIRISLSPER